MVKKWKIAYISSIVCQSDEAFEEILQKSRVNNARSDITGVLLRDAKSYFQYLEGPKFEIGECILRIAADHRHEAMTILMSMPAQVVFFDGWTLAEAQLPKRRKSFSSFARLLLKSEVNERIALIEKACMEAVPK